MIEENVAKILRELSTGNGFGEKVTLVAAAKTRTCEEIGRAIAAGVTDIGENRVQEFREKYDGTVGARRHFIGHLQTNKVKYLIGKTFLIHSVDRDELAEEIDARAQKTGNVQNILIQINIGCEESKGGYPLEKGSLVLSDLSRRAGLCVKGFMAMLPNRADEAFLRPLCDDMRSLFEEGKKQCASVEYLSMGMSGDWRLCVSRGANMIRLGTALFGERT